jgi:hypothetical protein
MFLFFLPSINACCQPVVWNEPVEETLRSQPDRSATLLRDPEQYRVHIICTIANEIFSDNNDEIGLPFLQNFGTAIYAVKKARERVNPADPGRFNVSE